MSRDKTVRREMQVKRKKVYYLSFDCNTRTKVFIQFSQFNISDKSLKHGLGILWFRDLVHYLYLVGPVITSWSISQKSAGSNNLTYREFGTNFNEFSESQFREQLQEEIIEHDFSSKKVECQN